ncbi:integrase, catalytic region, zinc finger, CCHC-type containing protein [Tanacetum coccineum]
MTTLADKSLLSGGDNKPPMLEKHLYDSWKSRMELYMMNRPHGRMILASVEKGPLVWPSITEDGVTRLKEYFNIMWKRSIERRTKLANEGMSLTNQEWEDKLLMLWNNGGKYTLGAMEGNTGKQRTVICYNCKGEGHIAKQCTKPKRKRDEKSLDPSHSSTTIQLKVPKNFQQLKKLADVQKSPFIKWKQAVEQLRLEEQGLVIAALKNELRKLKGKALDKEATETHSVDPKVSKDNMEPITPKLLNKRTAHSSYIKHTQEEALVLRDIIEHVKVNYPQDSLLESAFRYTKVVQDLLSHISRSCPSINNFGPQLVEVTPRKTDKKVRFTELHTSTENTKIDSTLNIVSNKRVLHSTRVRLSTSASGSQPSGNTKNDRILQTPSSNSKNKVEAHPRNVKSSLNKRNGTVKVNGSASVQNSKKHEILITTTNEVPFRKPIVLDSESPKPVVKLVYLRKPRLSKSSSGLGHNLFSVGQFCDSNLKVAFRQHTCFIRNLEGVDLLRGSRGDNLYTLSLGNMMASSPICLLSKASKTKSWLWHRRLSHLNFGAINHLARHGLVRGLPKLKFEN